MMRARLCILFSLLLVLLSGFGIRAENRTDVSARIAVNHSAARPGDELMVAVVVTVADDLHINAHEVDDAFLIPTVARVEVDGAARIGEVTYPEGQEVVVGFSEQPLSAYTEEVVFYTPLYVSPDAAPGEPLSLRAVVSYQACDDFQCYAPAETVAMFDLPVVASGASTTASEPDLFLGATQSAAKAPTTAPPGADVPSEEPEPPDLFSGKSALQVYLALFIGGLLLNLTPCVYPLIPVTIGFFTSQAGSSRVRPTWLAACYVFGLCLTYSTLGVAAALTGGLFGRMLQNPWVLLGIAAVMVALAASMFGLFEIRPPAFIAQQARARTGLIGALLMGLVMGIVAAPCVGPVVASLLLFVAQLGKPAVGFAMFFTLSLGLGAPYLVLGSYSGLLARLPQSGVWMVAIKRLFGYLLLVCAVYYARPVLPADWQPWSLPVALALAGVGALLVESLAVDNTAIRSVRSLVAAGMILAAGLLAPRAQNVPQQTWLAYSEEALSSARQVNRPVIIDFWATWCAACNELKHRTFVDPEVASELRRFTLIQVDATDSTPAIDKLLAQWRVVGLPTVVFLDSQGREVESLRLTAFESPQAFVKRARQVQ